jgi:transcriptional regulator with XRE-family HTH domain
MPKSLFTKRYKMFREEMVKAREAAGLSQEELAKRMGWDQTYVSKIERGVRRVDVIELIGICEAIGIDAAAFMKALLRKIKTTPKNA